MEIAVSGKGLYEFFMGGVVSLKNDPKNRQVGDASSQIICLLQLRL